MKRFGKKDWLQSYQKGSPHWVKNAEPTLFVRKFFRILQNHNLVEMKVLEIGVGNGRDSIFLARQGCQVVGIDLAPEAIKMAKKRGKNEKFSERLVFEVMDVESLSFKDNYFGAVCSIAVLHSCNLSKAFREIFRVLQPGGLAMLHLWQATVFLNQNRVEQLCIPSKVVNLFEKIGFQILKKQINIKSKKVDKEENPLNDHYHMGMMFILKKPKK